MIGDLIILAADKDIEWALNGLLKHRNNDIGIRDINFKIITHPRRDPGCYNEGAEFTRIYTKQYKHCMIIFDRVGSGQEIRSSGEIETILEAQLIKCGWDDRASAIAIDPEVEILIWTDSPYVERFLGWDNQVKLKDWLIKNKHWNKGENKPFTDPKAALKAALRQGKKNPSPAIFYNIASHVGLRRCTDPAFLKIREKLQEWFPLDEVG